MKNILKRILIPLIVSVILFICLLPLATTEEIFFVYSVMVLIFSNILNITNSILEYSARPKH